MSLGTKIGVGSIIGTISSILLGGYGSVIWMMIFSLITSSLIYYEAYLGKKYSINNLSGPYYIIKNGIKNNKLAIFSLILLIITYSFLFQMIQSNTISNILNINYNINKNIITICFIVIIFCTIKLNIKEIIRTMNKIVPIMCLLFIIISLYGVISNYELLFNNIKTIELFNIKTFIPGLIIGIKRSIFMNETLIGTTSISSGIDNNDIESVSKIQVLGNYFISFIITSLITLLLIIYNKTMPDYNLLVSNLYCFTSGRVGLFIITIIIILFGITTLLSGFYIGKSNINIFNNKKYEFIFNVLFIIFVIIGVYIENNYIWKILDILMYIMILINSYSIIKLLRGEHHDR